MPKQKQYMFVAGADSCGSCAGLAGDISDSPHGERQEGCGCQDEPVYRDKDLDCPKIDLNISVETSGNSVTITGEITVACCDGSESSESVEVELGERSSSPSVQEVLEALNEEVGDLGGDSCTEGVDVWIDDDEDDDGDEAPA